MSVMPSLYPPTEVGIRARQLDEIVRVLRDQRPALFVHMAGHIRPGGIHRAVSGVIYQTMGDLVDNCVLCHSAADAIIREWRKRQPVDVRDTGSIDLKEERRRKLKGVNALAAFHERAV